MSWSYTGHRYGFIVVRHDGLSFCVDQSGCVDGWWWSGERPPQRIFDEVVAVLAQARREFMERGFAPDGRFGTRRSLTRQALCRRIAELLNEAETQTEGKAA